MALYTMITLKYSSFKTYYKELNSQPDLNKGDQIEKVP